MLSMFTFLGQSFVEIKTDCFLLVKVPQNTKTKVSSDFL